MDSKNKMEEGGHAHTGMYTYIYIHTLLYIYRTSLKFEIKKKKYILWISLGIGPWYLET